MNADRDTAIGLMEQKRYSEALPRFLRLIEKHPEDWSLYYMTGQCYRFMNDLGQAVRYLHKASSMNNVSPYLYLALGIAFQLSEDYDSAIQALKQAVQLNPSLVAACNSIGLTYKLMGRLHEALEWYSRAAEQVYQAASNEVHRDPEKCYRDEVIDGKSTLTVLPHVFTKMFELLRADPTYAIVKNNMGLCLLELGEIETAREQFQEAIDCTPPGYNYPDPIAHLESIMGTP